MRIYWKLYISFLVIFIVTIVTVMLLSSQFYARPIHDEIENYFVSQARFLVSEYQQRCERSEEECEKFLANVDRVPQLHFWIVDRSGKVLLSHETKSPQLDSDELQRAEGSNVVTRFRHHKRPRLVMRIHGKDPPEFVVLERSFLEERGFPGLPLLLSLILTAAVVALLIRPLSLRFTRPVRQLHRLAQEWAEGRLEKRAEMSGKDEIAELGSVFNLMAENLQKSLQQRKEFLAYISHELKSPLARMRLACELILEETRSPRERAELVRGMVADVEDSESLIEQLLLLSRIEMNLPDYEKTDLDIGPVVEKAREIMKPTAQAAGVQMQISSEGTCIVSGDAAQLQRAFANILENAVKYSDSGKTVEVTLCEKDDFVIARFADQGIGIAAEEAEKIFEPFYRSRAAGEKEGAGLGLFLARRIVESHHGKIHAASNLPRGTVITVELPIRK